jgi:hypothetical protein
MKAISADQLAETLSKQLDIPIIDIDEKYSIKAKKTIPRYLCRQYGVLPLALKTNNILEVAMANPADETAITDLEHYTGKVIEPCLARQSDIEKEIKRKISLSANDFFSPQNNTWATRAIAALSLIMVVGLGFFTHDYIKKNREGTVSITDTHILYKNFDLILGVDKAGKVSLLGHGAFSKGYYSVSFDNPDTLKEFITRKEKDFSEQQRKWLEWAIDQTDSDSLIRGIAVKNQ